MPSPQFRQTRAALAAISCFAFLWLAAFTARAQDSTTNTNEYLVDPYFGSLGGSLFGDTSGSFGTLSFGGGGGLPLDGGGTFSSQASQTVTYTQQTAYLAASYQDGGGVFDQGSTQLGMWAHQNSKQVAAWRNFNTSGTATSQNKTVQVGDVFTIMVSATAAFGQMGFSLNTGSTPSATYANRTNGSRLFVQEDGTTGSWYVGDGTLNNNKTLNYNVSQTYTDYTFKVYITSQTTADIEIRTSTATNRVYNYTMGGSAGANITQWSMYLYDDWNGGANKDIYWSQTTSLQNLGSVNLGYYLTSGTYTPGIIQDGQEATSTTVSTNSVNVGGDSGTAVILNQANTYGGNTTINAAATAIAANNSAFGTNGTVTVSLGGRVQLSNGVTVSRALVLNGDGISASGALQNVSGNNTWSGGISNNSGARINSDTGLLTLSGSITNAASQTLYIGGAGNTTIGGTITGDLSSGNGALWKDGAGTLTLAPNSSGLTGLVMLRGGTISITNANSLGSGTIVIGDGATSAVLLVNSNTTRSATLSITNAAAGAVVNVAANTVFTLTGQLTQTGGTANTTKFGKDGHGTLIFAGTGSTYDGQMQIGQGTVILGTSSAYGDNTDASGARAIDLGLNIGDVATTNNVALLVSNGVTVSNSFYVAINSNSATRTIGLSGSGSVTFSNQFYMDGTLTVDAGSSASDSISILGNITNTGGLIKTNAGILVLSASNSYSGGTTLGQGTLRVGGNNALGTGAFTINGGTFASDGSTARVITNTITLGGNAVLGEASTGTGDLTLSGGFGLGSTARIVTVNNAQSTISGAVSGSGNFTKSGTGSLTLSGNNTFSGVLTVTEGKLTINSINNASVDGVLGNSANAVVLGSSGQTGFLHYTGGNASSTKTFTAESGGTAGIEVSNAATTLTLSGAIGGSGGVQKGGSGILLLSGTNTFTGALNIHDGTIQIASINNASANGALGNSAHAVGLGKTNTSNTGTLLYSGATNASTTKGFALESDSSGAGVINVSNAVALTVSGAITGGGRFQKAGAGTLILSASNSYTGATTVSAGRLVVNGTNTSSAVTVNSGASLGGSGKVGALTVSGLVAPGNSIGTLSAGNTVFNGGGSFELEVFNWTSTAGTGWDLLAITGNLTLSNTAGSPFTINLVSLQDSSTAGLSTNWNQNVNFTNTFITYTGSLLGTAFNANLFTVNTNGFQNPFNGTFSVTNVSGGLALLYTTSFVPSSTYTWNTNSGLWGTAGNWTNGAVPTNGASIIFSGAGGASTNSSTVSSIQGIVFTNGAGAYAVSGTALAIGAGGISNASSATQTISNNLSLSTAAAITAGGGNVTIAGNLTNGGNAVTVGGAANTTIGGVISGSGALTKSGSGSLSLANANTYTGATTISAGTVTAANNSSLGTTNGSTTVENGATLELSGGITTAENLTITGSGVGGGGAIRGLGNGENTLTGTITLGGNARINADSPTGAPVTLVTLGTDGFNIVSEYSSMTGYTQTATTWTMNFTNSPGENNLAAGFLGAGDGSLDLSGYSTLGAVISVLSAGGANRFTMDFANSDFDSINTYEGLMSGLASTNIIVPLSLSAAGTGDMSSVLGMTFSWLESGLLNVTFSSIVGIPTSSLTISGNIIGGANVLTLGAAGPSLAAPGGNVLVSGVISGTGNTNSGTITSLVKDGSGTLTLSGANTYTGDTRIETGTLTVDSGGTLGNGSDVFVGAGASLNVMNNISVSSFQGTTNSASIYLLSGTRLTMNGANKGTIEQNAIITGYGGLTLAGSGNTVLRLNSDNTFAGSTIVTGGVLELAATGADAQALRLSSSVSVTNAVLLISDSDQVKDTAPISLSGGTIRRGSGVSEVFGALTVSSASFLDFGTGAAGTLSFGTYTPSSLLTVQNFDFGSTLTFKSNLSGSITNGSYFSFVNGGISSYSWNSGTSTFTITAIPEPSTCLAVAGLLGVMLWTSRRRLFKDAKSMIGLRGRHIG